MNSFWSWFWIVLAVGALIGAVLIVRRRRYLAQLRALGWSHDAKPSLGTVADLHAPPFGLGLHRTVDELVCGTTTGGRAFRVFDYDYSGAGPRYSERIACVQLPFALPDVFVNDLEHARVGISPAGTSLVQAEEEGLRAIAADGGLAATVIAAIAPAVAAFRTCAGRVDLAVDGGQLVAAHVPRDPGDLQACLAALDPMAAALSSTALRGYEVAPEPARVGFYGHPDWRFAPADPGVLDRYPVTRSGHGHEVSDPITGLRDGIRLDAFTHEWKTTRTETYTDSQGRTRTRTVTDHHSEAVCGFTLPFDLPAMSVNGARVGEKVAFESDDFNRSFRVRAVDPKFASDTIHPRTMEWLLATRPRGWTVSGPVVTFEVEDHDLLIVDACEATLRGWLGRIPRFVWADLGLRPPPYLVE